MNDALVGIIEELVNAGDYIHDASVCHQDCPWLAARNRALKLLRETENKPTEMSLKDAVSLARGSTEPPVPLQRY